MTEGRKDGMTDKANTKCPLAILWWGHNKNSIHFPILVSPFKLHVPMGKEFIRVVISKCI